METVICIKDKLSSGKITNEIDISFTAEVVTVRDIIEARVRKEVEQYNTKLPDYFNGLVQPSQSERSLNGFRLKQRTSIDAEQQVYIALDAFQKNGYFILINGKQAEQLEQAITLTPQMPVNFVKLTPLVGG